MSFLNFNKLSKQKSLTTYKSSTDLFETLDRKATHQSLRPVQISALQSLDAQSSHKDIVLKLSTGAGKTVVALIYLEMMRRKYPGEMVVYLCPTTQLVEQVINSAQKIGILAESTSSTIPSSCQEGRSIFVCTYDKLFNGMNVFQKDQLIISSIVLDDVHAGIERVKQCYTLELDPDLFDETRDIFQKLCFNSDQGVWRGIMNNEYESRYEVPNWVWSQQSSTIAQKILNTIQNNKKSKMKFGYQNTNRYFDLTRLCISGTTIEISFHVPPTEENIPYNNAKHRLFMSASIKDGSSLIKELDCTPNALQRVIEVPEDKGAGERMILPTSIIDTELSTQDIGGLCKKLINTINIVVLTSSEKQALEWKKVGATIIYGDEIEDAVKQLTQSNSGHFYVFMQRFDGVDLPDEACRVLIVDGIPMGDRLSDKIDAERLKNSPGYNIKIINRLEQALGRAVRSSADYAATLLTGSDLASFIGRKDVKSLLEPQTLAQIDLGKDISMQLKAADSSINGINEAINVILSRDEDWKETYRERMSSITKHNRDANLSLNEEIALAERNSWIEAKARNFQNSAKILRDTSNNPKLHSAAKSDLLFKMAGYIAHFDTASAMEASRAAFILNNSLPRPDQLPSKKYLKATEQAVKIRDILGEYSSPNAAIAQLENIKNQLSSNSKAEIFERGLFELGRMLGAESYRPERDTGRGPDVLWLFHEHAFCIEAKNEKTAPIHKSDAEQLLMSMQWCSQENLGISNIIPVFSTDIQSYDREEDVSFNPRLLDTETIGRVILCLRNIINSISFEGPIFNDIATLTQNLTHQRLNEKNLALLLKPLIKS